jgi:hypothetical protein
MCVLIFSINLAETFFILRINGRDMLKMYIGLLHLKYRLFLSDFNETYNFPTVFRKNPHKLNLMKIRLLEAEFFQVDRRKDGQAYTHDEA